MLLGGSLGRGELKSISEEGREGGRLGDVHTHTHTLPDLAKASLGRRAVFSLLLELLSVASPPICAVSGISKVGLKLEWN